MKIKIRKNLLFLSFGLLMTFVITTAGLASDRNSFLYGIDMPDVMISGNIEYKAFFIYLSKFFPIWFATGLYIDMTMKNKKVELIRCHTYSRWFMRLITGLAVIFVGTSAAFAAVFMLAGGAHIGELFFVTMAHGLLMTAFYLLVRVMTGRAVLSVMILLFFETFTFVIGESKGIARYMPVCWGLQVRAAQWDNLTVITSISFVAAVVMTAAAYSIVKFRRKENE